MIHAEKILGYIDKHPDIQVVSLDVFDHLLDRRIPSQWVSRMAASQLAYRLNGRISAETIFLHRTQSHRESKNQNREWRLKNWLQELADEYQIKPDSAMELGKAAELNAEKMSLKPDGKIPFLLYKLRKRSIRIIALSDMWLEQEWLSELLQYFDIALDMVFTSCSQGHSKQSGTLFPHISRSLNIDPRNILHLGDNVLNDFIQPRRQGWHALWIPQPRHRFPPKVPSLLRKHLNQLTPPWRILVELLEPLSEPCGDAIYDMGYRNLAPFLILFSLVQWLIFRRQRIEHVFYLARDARLLLDAYDRIAEHFPDSPQRHYLRISRRSVALAHPGNLLLNARPLAGKVGHKTVGEWIDNFTITPALKHSILQESGLEETVLFTPFQKLLKETASKFYSRIMEERQQLRHFLHDYLLQTAQINRFERIGIVDSGWAGTIQDCLCASLGEEIFVSGIYLGVSGQGEPPSKNSLKYGLLRDDYRRRPWFDPWQATAGVIRVWDTLLRSSEAMTEHLHLKGGKIIPVARPNTDDGNLSKLLRRMQQGVFQGIEDHAKKVHILIETRGHWSLNDLEKAATYFASRLTTYPDHNTAKALLALTLEEGTSRKTKTRLGVKGIRQGTAWYPGIFSRYRVPIVSKAASFIIRVSFQHV